MRAHLRSCPRDPERHSLVTVPMAARPTDRLPARPAWCIRVHTEDDPQLGEPLCLDCYVYCVGHAAFNRSGPELWRRFTITPAPGARAQDRHDTDRSSVAAAIVLCQGCRSVTSSLRKPSVRQPR
jgi:hypothetical protein